MKSASDKKRAIQLRQIGGKIAYYRELRGLRQIELAQRANIKPDDLGLMGQGQLHNKFSVDMLFAIANVLKVAGAAFLTFCEDERRMWIEGDTLEFAEPEAQIADT